MSMYVNTLVCIRGPWIMGQLWMNEQFMNLEHNDWVYIHSIDNVLDRNQSIYMKCYRARL